MKTSPNPPRRPLRWLILVAGVCLLIVVATRFFREKPAAVSAPPLPATPASRVVVREQAGLVTGFDDARWTKWRAQFSEPGREAQLAAELEAMILADPARAFRLASAESDQARRVSLVQVVLMLWAELDPLAAAAQAKQITSSERASGVAAVLAGTSKDPGVAVKLAQSFCRDDLELALEHGYSLVNVLSEVGQFRAAVDFATEASAGAEGEEANKWLKAAFAKWAAQDPDAAMAAANRLGGPSLRFEALDAVAGGRVGVDPAGLAEALNKLPAGEDRNLVLGHALRTWVQQDAKTASNWINERPPAAEFDAAAEEIARLTQAQLQNQRPEAALSWAESIVNPELRSRSLATIVTRWAEQEPALARRFVETSASLLPSDRAELLSALAKRGGN